MRRRKNRYGVFGGLCSLCLASILFVGSVSAYMVDKETAENLMTIGENTIEIVENFQPPVDGYRPGDRVTKEIKVKNIRSVPCYVRVYLRSNEEEYAVPINKSFSNTQSIMYASDVFSNWWADGYGWYYYLKPLEVGETTTNLIDEVYMVFNEFVYWFEMPNIDMYVYAESVQDMGAKDLFNPSDFQTEQEYDLECMTYTWDNYWSNLK